MIMKIVRARLYVGAGGVYRRLWDGSVGVAGKFRRLAQGGYGVGKDGVLYVSGLTVGRRKMGKVRRFSLVFDKTFK